jgi:methionine-rich copper-binding protein CopC
MRVIFVILLQLFVMTPGAWAHASLDHASPAVGSTVHVPPKEVALTFSDKLEAAFSSLEVSDANGARVDQGKAQISGNSMSIGLKPLAAGTYRVHWRTFSIDTHATEGSFAFRVGE